VPDTVELTGTPGLLPLYARAVLPRSGGDSVPARGLRLRGVRPTPDDVAAYAGVCGFRLGSTLPPTYPHLLGFRLQLALMGDRAFPFEATGLVHVANDIEVLAPVGVGEALDVSVHAQGPRPHPKGRTVDLVTEVTRGDELVWRSASTYLRRGPGQPDAGTGGSDVRQVPTDLPATAVWRLPADLGRRYAAVSGDRNPIHLWPLTARLFGFPRPIAHGMWTAAASLAALEGRLPRRFRVAVAFSAPVLLPSTVELATSVQPDGAARVLLRSRRSGRAHLLGRVDPLT
jgi:acyl dehydratase